VGYLARGVGLPVDRGSKEGGDLALHVIGNEGRAEKDWRNDSWRLGKWKGE